MARSIFLPEAGTSSTPLPKTRPSVLSLSQAFQQARPIGTFHCQVVPSRLAGFDVATNGAPSLPRQLPIPALKGVAACRALLRNTRNTRNVRNAANRPT